MDEKARAAKVCSLHAVDIFAFVQAEDIPFPYFDTPYYLTPVPGEEKTYALLRETLKRSGRIGVACVMIRARQYLAALVPCGSSLVLNTLRFRASVRKVPDLRLPPDNVAPIDITEEQLSTTAKLVDSMTTKWDISRFHAGLRDLLIARIENKVREGQTTDLAFETGCEKPHGSGITDGALAGMLTYLAGRPQRKGPPGHRADHDQKPGKRPLIRWRRLAA